MLISPSDIGVLRKRGVMNLNGKISWSNQCRYCTKLDFRLLEHCNLSYEYQHVKVFRGIIVVSFENHTQPTNTGDSR
jgi:hypothetical protein